MKYQSVSWIMIILMISGCSPSITRLTHGQILRDDESALLVNYGKYYPEIGDILAVQIFSIDDERCVLSCSNFVEASPGHRKIVGMLQASKGGHGMVAFSIDDALLSPGWAYLVVPLRVEGRYTAALRKLCPSSDHSKTIKALLDQNIFAGANLDKPIECP